MARLLIFLAVFGPAQTWALSTPTTAPGSDSNEIIPRQNRQVEQVLVTVVTKMNYDPKMNGSHLNVLKTMVIMIDDFAQMNGVDYKKSLVKESVKNQNGKFAAVYTVQGSGCEEVENFARGARGNVNFIRRMRIKCGRRPGYAIN
ncbi:hypothetical protein NECAME_16661 [Necator americanus]|uniref:Uncharacterized protein n=1 Tax=Necator americanus TaxID=51031 RepID=W2TXK4_NECAM|nr:hypothetical protein NECAME_16661 [Necator americanus]ETN85766.1 hypothetical protein NECAME_16661 [Necator americanus]